MGCDLNPCSLMLYHTMQKAQVSNSRAIIALFFRIKSGLFGNGLTDEPLTEPVVLLQLLLFCVVQKGAFQMHSQLMGFESNFVDT